MSDQLVEFFGMSFLAYKITTSDCAEQFLTLALLVVKFIFIVDISHKVKSQYRSIYHLLTITSKTNHGLI